MKARTVILVIVCAVTIATLIFWWQVEDQEESAAAVVDDSLDAGHKEPNKSGEEIAAIVLLGQNDKANSIAQLDEANFVRSTDLLETEEQRTAEQAASAIAVDYYGRNVFIRWNPVLVDDRLGFLEIPDSSDDSAAIPKNYVRITPFPGTNIVAEKDYYSESNFGLTWHGKIVYGGVGWVTIKLLRAAGEEDAITVNISSDIGAFRIEPTKNPRYYVAMEHNSHRVHETVD